MQPPTFKDWCNVHCSKSATRASTHELHDEHSLQLSVRDEQRESLYKQMAIDILNGHTWHLSVSEFVCDEFRFFVMLPPMPLLTSNATEQEKQMRFDILMRQAREVQSCVEKFFPKSTVNASELLWCVVLANDFGLGRVVFPFLVVTRVQAQELLWFIEARLRREFLLTFPSNPAAYLEGAHVLMPLNVYYGQCARATGHGKNRCCPCPSDARHVRGLIYHGPSSAFQPRFLLDPKRQLDMEQLRFIAAHPNNILMHCTIFRLHLPLTSGYARPLGAEPMHLSLLPGTTSSSSTSKTTAATTTTTTTTRKRKRPLVEDQYYVSKGKEKEKDGQEKEKDGREKASTGSTPRKMELLDADKQTYVDAGIQKLLPDSDRRVMAFRQWFRASSLVCLGKRYEAVDVRFMKTNKKNDAYIVQLCGENVNYCPHAKQHHTDSTMYLHVLSKPSFCLHFRCHSKVLPGCATWKENIMTLPRDLSHTLFPAAKTSYTNLVQLSSSSAALSSSSSTNTKTNVTVTTILPVRSSSSSSSSSSSPSPTSSQSSQPSSQLRRSRSTVQEHNRKFMSALDATVNEQYQHCVERAVDNSVHNAGSLSPLSTFQQLLRQKGKI